MNKLRLAIVAAIATVAVHQGVMAQSPARVTLLHNNDGESALIGKKGFGGAAHFVSLVNQRRERAGSRGRDVLMLSSGDNFLAGAAFNASLATDGFFDAKVLDAIGYDAIALGNHDFDFGPDVLVKFVNAVGADVPYLSSNSDLSGEPALAALGEAGRIAGSVIIEREGQRYGVIGAVTERLAVISSPRGVKVGSAEAAIKAEVAKLEVAGVNKIFLISHLQSIKAELALIPSMSGIDAVVAGGGDELLLNADNARDKTEDAFGRYPLTSAVDADGQVVPVVTTTGQYGYLGELELDFDAEGKLTGFGGNSLLVEQAALEPDAGVTSSVLDPLDAALAAQAANVVARNEAELDGRRGSVRTRETNLGKLVTDAYLWQVKASGALGTSAGSTGSAPLVAMTNGGGMRNDAVIAPGDFTELDTLEVLPFPNFLTVVRGLDAMALKGILENAVSAVENSSGRFMQVGGLMFGYDSAAEPGSRVRDIVLTDGTVVYGDGAAKMMDGTVDLVTVDFLARGGDGFDFGDLARERISVSYQQALLNYLKADDGLAGVIPAERYNSADDRRIVDMSAK